MSSIVITEGGSSLSIAGVIASIFELASSIAQTVQNWNCENNEDLPQHCEDETLSISIKPALILPNHFGIRKTPPSLNDFVKHGIVVKVEGVRLSDLGLGSGTTNVLVFIGAIGKAWDTSRLQVYQGGRELFFNGKSVISSLLQLKYPMVVLPLNAEKSIIERWINPPNPGCNLTPTQKSVLEMENEVENYVLPSPLRSLEEAKGFLGKLINYSVIFGMALIPTYVPELYDLIYLMLFGMTTKNLYKKSGSGSDVHWELINDIRTQVLSASSHFPSFIPSGLFFPKAATSGSPSIALVPNAAMGYCGSQIPTELYYKYVSQSKAFFTLTAGSPLYMDGECGLGCTERFNIKGFLTLIELPSISYFIPAFQLIYVVPPPRSYNYDDIVAYARWLGAYNNFLTGLKAVIKAIEVTDILVSVYGLEMELADKLVNVLDWTTSWFLNMAVDGIAAFIHKEINSQPHDETSHSDEVSSDVHKAYMCARFGIC